MSSFSINSILDLQDNKCSTSPVDRVRRNALAFEQLEDQVTSKDYSDHRRSPNSSPALETDNASYEGKRYTVSCSMVSSILVACLIIWRSGVLEPESSYRTLILWSFVRLPHSLNVRISSPAYATRVLHFGFWISSYRRDASTIKISCFNYQTKLILNHILTKPLRILNNYKNTYHINITSLLQFTFGVVLFQFQLPTLSFVKPLIWFFSKFCFQLIPQKSSIQKTLSMKTTVNWRRNFRTQKSENGECCSPKRKSMNWRDAFASRGTCLPQSGNNSQGL